MCNLKLIGKVIKDTKIYREGFVIDNSTDLSYRDKLERCFIMLCKEVDIPVPLWIAKNTKEFVKFRRTLFFKEQFMEEVDFDRFEIKSEQN